MKVAILISTIFLISCGDKEGKTITNTVEGPKRCCRILSSEGRSGSAIGKSEYFYTGERMDSAVYTNTDLGKYGVMVYKYLESRKRESRVINITNGNRQNPEGYNVELVDECGNMVSQISYDKNNKEIWRGTFVYKCD